MIQSVIPEKMHVILKIYKKAIQNNKIFLKICPKYFGFSILHINLHYFSSKKILYEAVFEDTADVIWTDVSRARFEPTLVEAVEHLIDSSLVLDLQ